MEEYAALRKQLTERLSQIEHRLHRVETNRRRTTNSLEADWEEQAAIRQNDEVLDGLAEEEAQQVAAIRAALGRMDAGTYGVCTSCGELITTKRLEVLPYATQCLTCATQAEQGPRGGR